MTIETKDLAAAPPRSTDDAACVNTDRELYRDPPGDYYAASLHVTENGGIGINVGGFVAVLSLRQWHRLAWTDPGQRAARGPYPLVGQGNAAQPPPDLLSPDSRDLRRARELLGEIGAWLPNLCEYECEGNVHTPTCLRGKLDAFLGEQSEPDRKENDSKGYEGAQARVPGIDAPKMGAPYEGEER